MGVVIEEDPGQCLIDSRGLPTWGHLRPQSDWYKVEGSECLEMSPESRAEQDFKHEGVKCNRYGRDKTLCHLLAMVPSPLTPSGRTSTWRTTTV